MKTTEGVFSIIQYRRRFENYNANYEITYEGGVIYTPPSIYDKPAKIIIDEVKYGPGKSTLVGVRIAKLSEIMYDLKISCPR